MIKTPEHCLKCGVDWSGGAQKPGEPLEPGLRVFYQCGASLSYGVNTFNDDVYYILFKNCQGEKGR